MAKVKEVDKDIEKLSIEGETAQMSLFEIVEPRTSSRRSEYSNTIELYDALPKYVWEENREFDDLSKALVTRESTVRGNTYTVKVRPALIEKGDSTVLIYPGQREELVEDALRKIAVNGDGYLIEGKAGVMFTLYQLQQELVSTGHNFNINEIKEAIMVCRGATLECHSSDGEAFV